MPVTTDRRSSEASSQVRSSRAQCRMASSDRVRIAVAGAADLTSKTNQFANEIQMKLVRSQRNSVSSVGEKKAPEDNTAVADEPPAKVPAGKGTAPPLGRTLLSQILFQSLFITVRLIFVGALVHRSV